MSDPGFTRLTRRSFLVGTVGAAAAGLLAACGAAPTATKAPEPTATKAPAASVAPSASAAAPASSAAAGAGAPAASGTFSKDAPPAVPNAAQAKQFSGQKVTFYGGAVGNDANFDKILVGKFQQDTGIQINLVPGADDATERYSTYQRFFQGQSADMDAMMIDVIWPGAFAQHLIDLAPKLGDMAKDCFPSIIENNTVGGKLVGMPWFGDFGILYYRTDLLQKYGFSAPPKTWDELETQAKKIMDGEKGANANFAGFVFQGNAYEGLTCDALEWIASGGGGKIIENKKVTVNNPQTTAILNKVKGFVGTISPKGVTSYKEEDCRNAFQAGNAAFMRNWPYAYSLGNAADSPVKGKFDVTALPAVAGQKSVGTLGGWQIGVSKYSKAQDASIELARYLCSPEVVAWRGVVGSYVPLYNAVSNNPAVQTAQPYLKNLATVERVTRPSRELAAQYNEGSTAIYQAVNNILNGQDAAGQLAQMEQRLQRLVG